MDKFYFVTYKNSKSAKPDNILLDIHPMIWLDGQGERTSVLFYKSVGEDIFNKFKDTKWTKKKSYSYC
jgi:hypothetical protein